MLMDLPPGDAMSCERPKGLQHVPMCDFSEAWNFEGLTQVNWSLGHGGPSGLPSTYLSISLVRACTTSLFGGVGTRLHFPT